MDAKLGDDLGIDSLDVMEIERFDKSKAIRLQIKNGDTEVLLQRDGH